MTRSEALLARCADDLAAAAARPLLGAMTDGTVSDETFGRYLVLEEGFVRTAARLVALVAQGETDAAVAARLVDILEDLVGDQQGFLHASRAALPTAAGEPADALSQYALAMAEEHGAAAVAVCLAAAETLYATWCDRAAAMDIGRPAAVQGWIDMHATDAFREQAAFWRTLVDRIPTDIDDERLEAWFAGMLAAENTFHDAVYQEVPA